MHSRLFSSVLYVCFAPLRASRVVVLRLLPLRPYTRHAHVCLLCRRRLLFLVRGSFAGCFLDKLGEEARFATAAVAWLSSITTKETFLEDMTALDSMTSSFSLSSSKPLRLRNPTEPEAVAELSRDIHVDTLFGEVAFDENGQASR